MNEKQIIGKGSVDIQAGVTTAIGANWPIRVTIVTHGGSKFELVLPANCDLRVTPALERDFDMKVEIEKELTPQGPHLVEGN
jgi:hypothetical protein